MGYLFAEPANLPTKVGHLTARVDKAGSAEEMTHSSRIL